MCALCAVINAPSGCRAEADHSMTDAYKLQHSTLPVRPNLSWMWRRILQWVLERVEVEGIIKTANMWPLYHTEPHELLKR